MTLHEHLSSEGQTSTHNTVNQIWDDVGPKEDQLEGEAKPEMMTELFWRELQKDKGRS